MQFKFYAFIGLNTDVLLYSLKLFQIWKKELKNKHKREKNTQKIYVGYSGDDDIKNTCEM